MKRKSTFSLLCLICSLQLPAPAHGGTVDKLIGLLVTRGVFTQSEADDLRRDLAQEATCAPGAVVAPEPAAAAIAAGSPSLPPAPAAAVPSSPHAANASTEAAPALAPPSPASVAQPGRNGIFIAAAEKMRFSGDLRLRYDYQSRSFDPGVADWERGQPRFRLRFGVTAQPTDELEIGLRLASGSGVQNTTNQSFDDHARGKQIFIDQVYASWNPHRTFTVEGGKHENPFFTTPLAWDEDVTLEGVSEKFEWKAERFGVFANLTQFFVEELNQGTVSNPWMLGVQGGITGEPSDGVSVTLGATLYNFFNLDQIRAQGLADSTSFVGYNHGAGQQMIFDRAGNLLNEFRNTEFNGSLTLRKPFPFPLSFSGAYLKNRAADIDRLRTLGVAFSGSDPGRLLAYGDDDRDSGYQVGVALGNRGRKKDAYVQYFYQVLEDFAFPAVFVDSDFHGGGTNNRGHRLRFNYNVTDRVYFQNVLFFTQRDSAAKDGIRDENRAQFDLIFRF